MDRSGFRYLWNDSWTWKEEHKELILLDKELCDETMMAFRAATSDLGGVERGVACPLKQVIVHVPVISAQDRIQLLVIEIEGVHQRHRIGPELVQELFNVSGDLQGLGNTQQPGLQGTEQDQNNQ